MNVPISEGAPAFARVTAYAGVTAFARMTAFSGVTLAV